eukprot:7381362-Prymnesium_polylepis.1
MTTSSARRGDRPVRLACPATRGTAHTASLHAIPTTDGCGRGPSGATALTGVEFRTDAEAE